MTQSTTTPPASSPPSSGTLPNVNSHTQGSSRQRDDSDDSLSHLHRMSRTAGLGSGDYVAINVPAVIALVFGLGSALVIVDPLFLVLPIAGIVLAIIAVVQVKNSNGTQSGMPMAIIGLILSLGFFVFKAGGQTFQELRTRGDRESIEKILGQFGQDLHKGDERSMADAYLLFNSTFTNRVKLERFEAPFKQARASQFFGVINSLESNGQMNFSTDARTGEPVAAGLAIVHLAQGEMRDSPHWMVNFRKDGDHWRIEDLPELFPNEQATAAQRAAGGGAQGAAPSGAAGAPAAGAPAAGAPASGTPSR